MQLTIGQIQNILQAQYNPAKNENIDANKMIIHEVYRDSKEVTVGSLFVCIVGQRLDGHSFAEQAVASGASVLLVQRYLEHLDVAQLVVDDTIKALGKLAKAWRDQFIGKVIAITGSAGKTTLKDCLTQLLGSNDKKVACNMLNYNNQIGLPLSILATSGIEDYWVMEVGISQAHDMQELGEILTPDMAIILNAGAAHTEGLGEKGVSWHKAQLLKYIRKENSGTQAFVCADYKLLVQEAKKLCDNICFFSGVQNNTQNNVQWNTNYVELVECEFENAANKFLGKYCVSDGKSSFEVLTPFCGSYGAENISAMVAVANNLDFTWEDIKRGLQTIQLPSQRFNTHYIDSWTIIDDSYNANALSMQRMLEATVQKAKSNPCYVVLGAMGELGDLAQIEHENLGCNIAMLPIKKIFWKGAHANDVQKGLEKNHYAGEFSVILDEDDFNQQWENAKLSPGTVLFKGSRSNALEKLVEIVMKLINKK